MPARKKNAKKPQQFAAINSYFDKRAVANIYLSLSGVILLATTIFWSYLGSQVHQNNADHLANTFLFENAATFQQATLPGQHTFLIKWPIFFIIHLLGSTERAFTVITVLTVLATIGLFVFLLSRINRKPIVLGTVLLGFASVLLLIPAESYPGALLPVNMAMIANRNLEYVLYIYILVLIIRGVYLLSWRNLLAIILMAILIASDKLFMAISIGGGLIGLIIYLILQRRTSIYMALRWIITTVLATILAAGLLWIISALHLTSIANEGTAGPYGIVFDLKNLLFGIIYGILGFLTNLGANPVSDVTIAKDIASQLMGRLGSVTSISYASNFIITIIGIVWGFRLLRSNPMIRPDRRKKAYLLDTPIQIAQALIFTTLASLFIFIISDHYYAVDSRYLTIVLFSVFVILTTYLRKKTIQSSTYVLVGILLVISITIGVGVSWRTAQQSLSMHAETANRNSLIVDALSQHPVDSLLGDYWRVYPIKLSRSHQNIVPLSSCTTIRDMLTSKEWQKNMSQHSFAYVLTIESSVTQYPACNINQVVAKYGRPSSAQIIAGSINAPKEVLLFYDNGANTRTSVSTQASAIQPRLLTQLPNISCNGRKTIMNIVAHQDDDLLFASPDLIHSIRAGDCIRSIYMTAGDSGSNSLYWLGREQGSEAAYAQMLGLKDATWISRIVQISNTGYATIAYIPKSPAVSLVFLHLPDGNVSGKGFKATNYESLARLKSGKISRIHSVDGQSEYTSEQLISSLVNLIDVYLPNEIRTQTTHNLSMEYPDHSDHIATGSFATNAFLKNTENQSRMNISYYIGYPIRSHPENVNGSDLNDKERAFFSYAQHDNGTCISVIACSKMSYIHYLKRQYTEAP